MCKNVYYSNLNRKIEERVYALDSERRKKKDKKEAGSKGGSQLDF